MRHYQLRLTLATISLCSIATSSCGDSSDAGRAPVFSSASASPSPRFQGAGSFTADEASRLWGEARSDVRFTPILRQVRISRVVAIGLEGSQGVLFVEFSQTLGDESAWPAGAVEICAIGHAPGMTGMLWQVRDGVVTPNVSPRWGDVDCMGGIEIPD